MSALAGTGALVRLMLRRDRWRLALWVVLLAAYPIIGVANASPGYDALARTPGFLMLYGPLYASTVGAIATWSSGDILFVYGLVSALMVIRHTRADEEAGRGELLGASVLGRQAAMAAALVVVLAANVALAALITLGVIGQGLPVAGSVALGVRFAAVGCVFAAVAAVTAQLAQSATAARGLAVIALGAALLVRAPADASGSDGGAAWLAWLSPVGWAHRIRPFADERWWVLVLFAAATVALVAVAVALSARRDVGAGVLPTRAGPATAAPTLRTPLALAWRLHRGLLLGWAVGFALIGAVFGGAAKSAGEVFRQDQQVRDLFARLGGEAAANDVFLAAIMGILGLIAAAYAVQATLRLRAEEEALRADPLLAAAVGRLRWAVSHMTFALLGPAVALAAAGLTAGLVYGIDVGDPGRELPRTLAGAIVQLPAVWVLAAATIALSGLLPRLASGGWVAWVACLVIWTLSATGQLGQRLPDASPFSHVPKLPGAEFAPTPLIVLFVIAALLTVAGLIGVRRRDIGPA